MPHAQLLFRDQARARILAGASLLADAVRPTLGPKDRCVLIDKKCEGDEATGLRILRTALEAPARQVAASSGADPGVVVDRLRSGTGAFGFDARRGEYLDLVEAGIIDPTKVVRIALENAVSVAGTLLLAEATLTEIDDDKNDAQPELPAGM